MVPVEPISLSIGAIALGSLFSTCVQCFDYVDSAKAYSRDYFFMISMLEAQRVRLLLWGKAVGLIDEEGPIGRLWWWESPLCRPVIQSILDCIRIIFEDTHRLTTRYGLKQLKQSEEVDEQLPHKPHSLLATIDHISIFKAKTEDRRRRTSVASKARWAIHDKAKFENLIKELRQFIDGLEQITSVLDVGRKRRKSMKAAVQSVLAVGWLCRAIWMKSSRYRVICIGKENDDRLETPARVALLTP